MDPIFRGKNSNSILVSTLQLYQGKLVVWSHWVTLSFWPKHELKFGFQFLQMNFRWIIQIRIDIRGFTIKNDFTKENVGIWMDFIPHLFVNWLLILFILAWFLKLQFPNNNMVIVRPIFWSLGRSHLFLAHNKNFDNKPKRRGRQEEFM